MAPPFSIRCIYERCTSTDTYLRIPVFQTQATLFHLKSKGAKLTEHSELIGALEQCLRCTASHKGADLNTRLAKVHMLMADVYHLADELLLEASELTQALTLVKREQ